MAATLNEEVPLGRLASEWSLSVRHFARAFRQSTGVPPYRWLLEYRVGRARELLSDRSLSLADVALACVTPGKWRSVNGSSGNVPMCKMGK